MHSSLARRVRLGLLLATCSVAFVACTGDDDYVGPEDGDDDQSSSGNPSVDGGSSSGRADGGSSGTTSSGGSTSSGSSSGSSSGAVPTFSVGGVLAGLTSEGASVSVQNNGTDTLVVSANGSFTFPQKLADEAAYAVTVSAQPPGNRCAVQDGEGTIDAADVTGVQVTCVPAFTVGGTVTGLKGSLGLGSGTNTATVAADGSFTLSGNFLEGDTFDVAITSQPVGQLCTLVDASGTIPTGNVTNVAVSCRDLAISIDEVYATVGTGHWGDTNGDGVADGAQDEFVEIMNDEAFEVSIAGIEIRTGKTGNALGSRFTFPAGTVLPAGGRAVIFSGGTPTGSFGGAQTFVRPLALTDDPSGADTFTVQLYASPTLTVDEYVYDTNAFVGSCTTACVSRTRDATGAMVTHSAVTGVQTSPGVAQANAVPKLLPTFGLPKPGALGVSVTTFVRAQYNMAMNPTQIGANLVLTQGACGQPGTPVATAPFQAELGDSAARLTPNSPLVFDTTYCLTFGAPNGAAGGALDPAAPANLQFTTRAAVSAPAPGLVISQIGGPFTAPHAEYVELYNASAAAIDMTGFFLQRRAAGGGASCFAKLPAGATIQPRSFFLVGGAGYAGATTADFASVAADGTALTGTNETVVLLSGGSCTRSFPEADLVVDTVSYGTGAITDLYASLALPALPVAIGANGAIRRKACLDSTADANVTTGVLATGGHANHGNNERIGASNADFLSLTAAAAPPRNGQTPPTTGNCN